MQRPKKPRGDYSKVDIEGNLIGYNKDGIEIWRQKAAEGKRRGDRTEDLEALINGNAPRPVSVKIKNKVHSPAMEEMICMLVMEGFSIHRICQLEEMPSRSVLADWCIKYPDFKKRLDDARKHRAEHFHDEIVNISETVNEFNSKSAKVKLEALKFLAGVGDRDKYGNQTKLTGDADNPIGFIFDTGITRKPLEDAPKPLEEIPPETLPNPPVEESND